MHVKNKVMLLMVAALLVAMMLTVGGHTAHGVAMHVNSAFRIVPMCGEVGGPPCIH